MPKKESKRIQVSLDQRTVDRLTAWHEKLIEENVIVDSHPSVVEERGETIRRLLDVADGSEAAKKEKKDLEVRFAAMTSQYTERGHQITENQSAIEALESALAIAAEKSEGQAKLADSRNAIIESLLCVVNEVFPPSKV